LRTDDDAAAIRRCRSGDIRGLDALMAHHQVQVLRVAYLLAGDRMQADDVVQDSFLQVFRTIAGTSPRHLHLAGLGARRRRGRILS
jgi:DNA-directed RNA polymerase specialized sigma24 family protein